MNFATRIALPFLLPMALLGCDTLYGVGRSAYLDSPPSVSCILKTLEDLNEIERVGHKVIRYEVEITDSDSLGQITNHNFNYRVGDLSSYVHVLIHYKGTILLDQGYTRIGIKPPQDHIDRILPVMKTIELSLEKNCGIENLTSKIKEFCSGVICSIE